MAATRSERAEILLERMRKGPPEPSHIGGVQTAEEYRTHVRIWMDSWVTPHVQFLIPELRDTLGNDVRWMRQSDRGQL